MLQTTVTLAAAAARPAASRKVFTMDTGRVDLEQLNQNEIFDEQEKILLD